MASGFASLRRFNDLFRKRYRMTPGVLRRASADDRDAAETLAFDLAYRTALRLGRDAGLPCQARRGRGGSRGGREATCARSVPSATARRCTGGSRVAPSRRRAALRVVVSASLALAIPSVLARVKHLFDLACHPDEICSALGPLAASHPGLRLPVRHGRASKSRCALILGQQVTRCGRRHRDRWADSAAAFGARPHRDAPHAARLLRSSTAAQAIAPLAANAGRRVRESSSAGPRRIVELRAPLDPLGRVAPS